MLRLGFDCWSLFYRILWFPLIGPHTFSMPSCVSPMYSGVVYVIVYIMCPHERHCQLNRWKAELLIPSHLSPHATLNLILLRSLIFMSSDFHSPRCSGQKLGSHLDASLWGPCIYCVCRPCQTSPPNIPIPGYFLTTSRPAFLVQAIISYMGSGSVFALLQSILH